MAVTLSCGSDPGGTDASGSGGNGAAASGGGPGAGGSFADGGVPSSGGAPAFGGASPGSGGSDGFGGSCEAPGDCACSLVRSVRVPFDLFDDPPRSPELDLFGDEFLLRDTGNLYTNIAVVSWDGVETAEHHEWSDYCGSGGGCDFLAMTALAKEAGGLQLLAARRGPYVEGGGDHMYELSSWDDEANQPTDAHVFDGGYNGQLVMFDLETSHDGRRAVFSLANLSEPAFALVGEDAAIIGTPMMPNPAPTQKCLEVVPTAEAATISSVTRSASEVIWHLRELDAAGELAFEANLTLPLGTDDGFTGCPTVVPSPTGYAGAWDRNYGSWMIVSVERDSAADDPPDILEIPEDEPGLLLGVLGDEFLIMTGSGDGSAAVARRSRDGTPGGPGYPVPTAVSTPDALPAVLGAHGSSFVLTYGTEAERIIEEVECP